MTELEQRQVDCPYCGESIELLIDPSIDTQDYIEDCSVCCRPIVVKILFTHTDLEVSVYRDDE